MSNTTDSFLSRAAPRCVTRVNTSDGRSLSRPPSPYLPLSMQERLRPLHVALKICPGPSRASPFGHPPPLEQCGGKTSLSLRRNDRGGRRVKQHWGCRKSASNATKHRDEPPHRPFWRSRTSTWRRTVLMGRHPSRDEGYPPPQTSEGIAPLGQEQS